jgi:glycerol-3-phosphate acyltransferase PlsY
MNAEWFFYAGGAYVLGSIPFGKIVAEKVGRIDIRKRGSGNIGATNVARELGVQWGFVTLLLDLLKGFIPVIACVQYGTENGLAHGAGVSVVGLCALLGHQFSIFQKFRGGKGVSTALGVYLGITPLVCIPAILLFIIVVYKWDFISLGAMISAGAIPFLLWIYGQMWPEIAMSLVMAILICIRHKENIQRLIRGEENRWRKRDG